jgi:hypothetical protein
MKAIFFLIDLFLLPVIFLISLIFYAVRVTGDKKLVMCNKLLLIKGILPTRTYFEESPK